MSLPLSLKNYRDYKLSKKVWVWCNCFTALLSCSNREGIKNYFLSIARISLTYTIIYNIPSCTGYNIVIDLIREMALKKKKIICVKATIDSHIYIKDLILSIKKERRFINLKGFVF